jgi:hypothetical protein
MNRLLLKYLDIHSTNDLYSNRSNIYNCSMFVDFDMDSWEFYKDNCLITLTSRSCYIY